MLLPLMRHSAPSRALLLTIGLAGLSLHAQVAGTITTVAGGYTGDGGPATVATIAEPIAVAVRPDGTLYIADFSGNHVRRLGPDGIITTFAGTGLSGFNGDGGHASGAQLNKPSGVAVMADGVVLIADAGNNRIRRVATDGQITTFAGTGVAGYSGDGGPAAAARLFNPYGVTVAPDGSVLISDTANSRVRRVGLDGKITTVAGTGVRGNSGDGGLATAAQLNNPVSTVALANGSFYIADNNDNRIRKVGTDGKISTFAGTGEAGSGGNGGPATAAKLNAPYGVAVLPDGSVVIGDSDNHQMRKVAPDGTISTIAGSTALQHSYYGDGVPALTALFELPRGLAALPDGTLYVADFNNHRVRRIAADGRITTVGGGSTGYTGDKGPAINADLAVPVGVSVLADGSVYIADTNHHRIRKVSPDGTIATVAGNGTPGWSGDGGQATAAQLKAPNGVSALADGTFFIADTENNRIRRVTPDGKISTWVGTFANGPAGDGGPAAQAQLNGPYGVAAIPGGTIFIADSSNHKIRKVTPEGIISTVAGNGTPGFSGDRGPATNAQMNFPLSLFALSNGTVFVAELSNHRIRRVDPSGQISTVAGNGTSAFSGDGGPATSASISGPWGVTASPDGTIFIGDTNNQKIRRVGTNGVITTLAGTNSGYSGDGLPGTQAQLNYPLGLAVASDGTVYVADGQNNRIRAISGRAGPLVTPVFTAFPAQVTYVATAGATDSLNQIVVVGTSVSPVSFTAKASASWIQVTPNSGSSPANLTITGDPTGMVPGRYTGNVTLTGNVTNSPFTIPVTLTVAGPVQVTITSVPTGTSAIVDGVTVTTPRNFNWAPGSLHAVDVPSQQTTGGTRLQFDHWSQGGVKAQTVIVPQSATTYTAFLSTQFLLTAAASPASGGTLTWSPGSPDGFYPDGTQVAFKATPSSGFSFANFSGDLAGTSSPQVLNMTGGAKTVAANFSANVVNIKVTLNSNPPGRLILVDGTAIAPGAVLDWAPNSTHTIEAPSPQGVGSTRYAFDRWSMGGAGFQTITAPAADSVFTVSFNTQYLLATTISPSNSGSLTADPASVDGFYSAGTQVQLTATASSNFTFGNFSGDLSGAGNQQTITLAAPASVKATFTPNSPLSVTPSQLPALTATQGSAATATLQVTGGTPGQIVLITTDQPWLGVNPSQGVVPFSVNVTTASSGLSPDTYHGNVTVGGTLTAPVTFVVSQPLPTARLLTSALDTGVHFDAIFGGSKPPTQRITVTTSDGSAVKFNATATYLSSPQDWLIFTRSEKAPGYVDFDISLQNLTVLGSYSATVVLTAEGSPSVTIPVTVSLTKPPVQIIPDLQEMKLSSVGSVEQTSLMIKSTSAGLIPFSVSYQTDDGGSWLRAGPPTASVADAQAAVVQVTADPTGLPTGTYGGRVTITDQNNQTSTVRVVFAVTAPAPAAKLLRPAIMGVTMRFGADVSGSYPQLLELLAYGSSAVAWTAKSNVPWITFNNGGAGVVLQGSTTGSPTASFDLGQLQIGSNRGLITIQSDAVGGDLLFPVEIQKFPRGVPVSRLAPLGIVFIPPFAPRSDVAYVAADANVKLTLTPNQPDWLKVDDISSGNLLTYVHTLRVSVNSARIPTGSPQAALITVQEPGGAYATMSVLAYAPAAGGSGANVTRKLTGKDGSAAATANCTPKSFIPLNSSFQPYFDQDGGAATSTEIVMIDNCGNPVTSGVTGGTLSNGDPQLNLRSLGDGRWNATWNPVTANPFVTLSIQAADPDNNLTSTTLRAYSIVKSATTGPALDKVQPFETEAGVRLPALTPSMRFRIRGQNFINPDGSQPIVTVGGKPLQVVNATNSQMLVVTPDNLPANVEMQLTIQRTDAASVPEPVISASSWPVTAMATGIAQNEVILTGLGTAPMGSLVLDGGGRIVKVERVGAGLWRVISDRSLEEGARFRVQR